MTQTARETDVLVLGGGPAGASAALEAARAGASVLLLDSRSEIGGNGAFSTGYMAFAGSEMQRELGIADSPEALLADMVAEVERQQERFAPEFDAELARLFAERTADTYDFLRGLGFEFGRLVPRPKQHTANRMTVVQNPAQFRDTFEKALVAAGAEILLRAYVLELVREGRAVTGARVRLGSGERVTVRARSGVVVALGGYQAGEQLRARFLPAQNPRAPYPGLDTAVGDGHVMMEAAGADLVNMTMLPQLVRAPSRFIEEVIAVNAAGERFEDEPGPYDERLERLLDQPEGIGYYICDAVGVARVAQIIAEMPAPAKIFNRLQEAARAIGCESDVLLATVSRWNEIVDSGVARDPDFGRVIFPDPRRGIVTPPYSVIPMVPGVAGSVGGARVTLGMQVLDTSGKPITGLYTAGDTVGVINPATGLGGIHLTSAVTLGRVAGATAAASSCPTPARKQGG